MLAVPERGEGTVNYAVGWATGIVLALVVVAGVWIMVRVVRVVADLEEGEERRTKGDE